MSRESCPDLPADHPLDPAPLGVPAGAVEQPQVAGDRRQRLPRFMGEHRREGVPLAEGGLGPIGLAFSGGDIRASRIFPAAPASTTARPEARGAIVNRCSASRSALRSTSVSTAPPHPPTRASPPDPGAPGTSDPPPESFLQGSTRSR